MNHFEQDEEKYIVILTTLWLMFFVAGILSVAAPLQKYLAFATHQAYSPLSCAIVYFILTKIALPPPLIKWVKNTKTGTIISMYPIGIVVGTINFILTLIFTPIMAFFSSAT
jgi:hypothetical protein